MSGRFRLQSRIGGGGMGAVWLATDESIGRKVAIKRIQVTDNDGDLSPEAIAEAERKREAALREGRNLAQLSHPHVVSVYDLVVEGGVPWLVMELVPSRSLAQVLSINGTIPPLQAAQVGAQLADALSYAHHIGIIHRDIKPGNVLVTDRGERPGVIKISDFGISRGKNERDDAAKQDEQQQTVITGTPAYFAPEVARGDFPDEASDVYALGATLYTLCEGTPPFGSDLDTTALMRKVAMAHINPPEHSGVMTDILLAMLEPNPQARPTMLQARNALAALYRTDHDYIPMRGMPVIAHDGMIPAWVRGVASNPLPSMQHLSESEAMHTLSGLVAVDLSADSGKPAHMNWEDLVDNSSSSPRYAIWAAVAIGVMLVLALLFLMMG